MTNSSEEQKRSDFRTETSYPIWYRYLTDEDQSADWRRTITRDLSGGGASFELSHASSVSMKSGDLLEVQVVIPPSPVFAIAKIVRVFRDDRGHWCAGVMFASIEPSDKDRIVRTVLSEGVGRP